MAYTKQNFEDGQTLKAEHLNKMEDELAREKSWDELAHRPFGEAVAEIIPETEVTGVETDGMYIAVFDPSAFPTEAEQAKVIFDGVVYTSDYVWNDAYGAFMFGNKSILGGVDTGEPFLMLVAPGELAQMAMPDADTHRVEIFTVVTELLDVNYLPNIPAEKLPRAVIWDTTLSGSPLYLYRTSGDAYSQKNAVTKDEFLSVMRSGVTMYINYNGYYYPIECINFTTGQIFFGSTHTKMTAYTAEYTPAE